MTRRWRQNPVLFTLIIASPFLAAFGWLQLHEYNIRRLARRVNAADPASFFVSSIREGMSRQEVARVVPAPDRTNFFVQRDGSVVQQLIYAGVLGGEYHVYVAFDSGRVENLEFDDRYLGPLTRISEGEAMKRLQAGPRLNTVPPSDSK
jgi:hypothetical protein